MTLLVNKQCHQVKKGFIALLLDDIACQHAMITCRKASLSALAALKRDATEEENFKMQVLFQQCSTELSEAELGHIPGFSDFVICAIKNRVEPKRKMGEGTGQRWT